MGCIFCKIINKEMPADVVFENDKVSAFKDVNPKAPIHILIVPKKHIESITTDGSEDAVKDLIIAAKEIAKQKGINGYKLHCYGIPKEDIAVCRAVREAVGDDMILMFDAVTCAIPGAKRPSQAEENFTAADFPPLSEKTMTEVKKIYDNNLRELVHHYW